MSMTLGAAFVSGVASSLGPCTASRALALRSLCTGLPMGTRVGAWLAMLGGCAVSYAAYVLAVPAWHLARVHAGVLYATLAICMTCIGLSALRRACGTTCAHERRTPVGAAASLVGMTLGALLSPCCAPFLATLSLIAMTTDDPRGAASVAATFAAGHMLLLGAVAAFPSQGPRAGEALHRAGEVIGAGVAFAAACFYAVLV